MTNKQLNPMRSKVTSQQLILYLFFFTVLAPWLVQLLSRADVCVQALINLHGLTHILLNDKPRMWLWSRSHPIPLLWHNSVFATRPFLSFPYDTVFFFLLGNLYLSSSEIEGDRVLLGSEAPWRVERDRGRRPRQYISPGESRKTSERFRTQPITSAEHQETDRYCSELKNAWLRKGPDDHAWQHLIFVLNYEKVLLLLANKQA